MTKNRFILALNSLGRALIGDINGPHKDKISPDDIHVLNGYLVMGGVEYTAEEAVAITVAILRRIK